MKKLKIVAILTVLIMVLTFTLLACKPKTTENKSITVAVPDGAPALAIAKLVKDNAQFEGYDIKYKVITGGAAAITKATVDNEVDFLLAPTNLGAILHNKFSGQKEIKLIANMFNSLLYLVGKDENIKTLDQLKGEVVYIIGKGATPDLTFQYILEKKEIDFAETDTPTPNQIGIKYASDGSEVLPMLKKNTAKFAILGEPAVTVAINSMSCFELFSLNELWNETTNTSSGFPQASFFGIGDVLKDIKLVTWFSSQLSENVTWVKNNPAEADNILRDAQAWSSPVKINTTLLERSNFDYISSSNAKVAVDAYMKVLHGLNPKTIGGSIPSEDFYA